MTNRRWVCPSCGTAGWTSAGNIPPHDSTTGKPCRLFGQLSEKESKKKLARELKEKGK